MRVMKPQIVFLACMCPWCRGGVSIKSNEKTLQVAEPPYSVSEGRIKQIRKTSAKGG